MLSLTSILWTVADRLGYVPKVKHKKRKVYAVRRVADGKWWAGPHRWKGSTFSTDPRFWYLVGTETAARAAVEWSLFMSYDKRKGLAQVEIIQVELRSRSDLRSGAITIRAVA